MNTIIKGTWKNVVVKDGIPHGGQFIPFKNDTDESISIERSKALKQKKAKPPIYRGLINYFPRALTEVARVSAFGAIKHDFDLADKGFLDEAYSIEGYLDAVGRHLTDRAIEGEINHSDGDLYHLAQTVWDSLAALEKILIEKENE